MTESGKTTLATRLSKTLSKDNHIIVYDPRKNGGWTADYETSNFDDFTDMVKGSRECIIFVDEAGQVCRNRDVENYWLATDSRHYGHSVFFIAQRPGMVALTIRTQCKFLYCFFVNNKDANDNLVPEWGNKELAKAEELKQGEYFYYRRFGELKRYKLF